MELDRRSILTASMAAALVGRFHPAVANDTFYTADKAAIQSIRVYSDTDGVSRIEDLGLPVTEPPGGNGGAVFQKNARRAVVFSGPANALVPARNTPHGTVEFLYVMKGETTFICGSAKRTCSTGTVLIFEDTDGMGHEERVGPDGYLAVKVSIPLEAWT